MEKKRVLLLARPDFQSNQGGDSVQIEAIYTFLKEKGFEVCLKNELFPDCREYDMVILFNLTRPFDAYIQSMAARKANVPYLLFPIYWNLDAVIPKQYSNGIKKVIRLLFPDRVVNFARAFRYWKRHKLLLQNAGISLIQLCDVKKILKEIICHASFLCPNSEAEAFHLQQELHLPEVASKCKVIKNGVDHPELDESTLDSELLQKLKKMEYVCCVGGIGPRKNQLLLVQAAVKVNVPLVIVGKAIKENEAYFRKVQRVSSDHIFFTGHQDKKSVLSILSHAKGHIQPSFIETPGLASLEAASIGCKVCVSDVPPVREYFQDHAIYCDPTSIDSIAAGLIKLIEDKSDGSSLSQFILDSYHWNKVLEPLPEIIRKTIEDRNGRL